MVAEYKILSSSDNTSYTGKIKIVSTGQIAIEAEIEDAPKRVFVQYVEGTGAVGGWGKSRLRKYLYNTILPKFPENVRAHLKTVLKNHTACNTAGDSYTQTTEEMVCIPSYPELFHNSSETNQPRYKALFPNNASRIKKCVGETNASSWWTRETYSNHAFRHVSTSGSGYTDSSNYSRGVSLCFFT